MTRRRSTGLNGQLSKLWRGLVVAAILGGVAACSGGSGEHATETSPGPTSTTTAPRVDDQVLTIGAWLPSTGPGAAIGGPMLQAVREQVDQINEAGGVLGKPVRLKVANENSETGLNTLVSADVDAIVGPASSLVALSQLGTITQPGTGIVSCSPTATALRLDNFPDNNYAFRTIPSDSLQMEAIARRAQLTGVNSVSIGYLDDPYGRGLTESLKTALDNRRISVVQEVGFAADQQDLSEPAAELARDNPGLIVVLADADDGGRILSALSEAVRTGRTPSILVNDSLSGASQTVQQLPRSFREQITGVAPQSLSQSHPTLAPFAANAADCVNLIALAATQVESDNPSKLRNQIAAVSSGGRECRTYADCVADLVNENLNIDYYGLSGTLDLASTSGDPQRATFDIFKFDSAGTTILTETIDI